MEETIKQLVEQDKRATREAARARHALREAVIAALSTGKYSRAEIARWAEVPPMTTWRWQQDERKEHERN